MTAPSMTTVTSMLTASMTWLQGAMDAGVPMDMMETEELADLPSEVRCNLI